MRSEKVYMMTQLIHQKVEQLAGEKHLVKERYTEIDDAIATQKHRILQEYEGLVAESDVNDDVKRYNASRTKPRPSRTDSQPHQPEDPSSTGRESPRQDEENDHDQRHADQESLSRIHLS